MSEEPIRRDWVGRVIDGRFTLQQWLGGSRRSGVFLTELPGPPARKAAIKIIQADAEDAEACLAGWSASTPLLNPHLIRLFQSGRCYLDDQSLIYVVMEYSDEVLADILLERALTPDETREMLEPVLNTLSWLHGKGFVHGHLKPSNIMVVDDQLKLTGDSLYLAGETGNHFPTPGIYQAPEAVAGMIAPAADVWSLGVMLVEVMTQHLPAWDRSHDKDPVVPETLPQPFAGIARGCLQADPAGRCTLNDVRAWLKIAHPATEPDGMSAEKAPARKGVIVLVSAAVVLLVAVAAFEVHAHKPQSSPPASPEAGQQAPAPAPVQDQPPPSSPAPAPPIPAPQAQEQTPPVAPSRQQAPAAVPPPAQASPPQSPRPPVSNGSASNGAVAERAMPDVLPAAIRSIQGKVNVRVRISVDAAGNVSDAELESPGPSKYFAKASLEAARKWKFKPAQANGQAAPSTWTLDFKFTRDGAEVTPVEAQ